MDLPETKLCLDQLRYVEISYVCLNASLDLLHFVLTQPRAQLALGPIISGVEDKYPNWTHIGLVTNSGQVQIPPVRKEAVLALEDHLYATVYFGTMRDIAMVVKRFLQQVLATYYIQSRTVDQSWFHSWRDFVIYSNIDIESIPGSEAMDRIFSLDEYLAGRESGERRECYGQKEYLSAIEATRDFIHTVSEMVAHDLGRKWE